jgi:hypothetical protein
MQRLPDINSGVVVIRLFDYTSVPLPRTALAVVGLNAFNRYNERLRL